MRAQEEAPSPASGPSGRSARLTEIHRTAAPGRVTAPPRAWQAQLRSIVLSMERKAEQLVAVRRTHDTMVDELASARSEVARTRHALEETAETAAARWRRIQALEGHSQLID